MSIYTCMSDKQYDRYLKRQTTLEQAKAAAAKAAAPDAPLPAPGPGRGVQSACEDKGRKTRLAVPVMTADEAAQYTLKVEDVKANPQALQALLASEGIAIVVGVASPDETKVLEEMWTSDLLALAEPARTQGTEFSSVWDAVAAEGPTRWPQETLFADKFSEKRGLCHGQYAWASRLHPSVRMVFAAAHGVDEDELCVGMDHIFFNPRAAPEPKDDRYWMHADHNTHSLPGRECYQGILYTWSAEAADASTTVVWPRSHLKVFDALMDDPAAPLLGHFVQHTAMQDAALRKRLIEGAHKHARRVPVPAGALLLWNSKVSHQGWAAGRRLAAPICWEPACYRQPDALKRKIWMAATGMPSSHWATLAKVHTGQGALLTEVSPARGAVAGDPHTAVLPLLPSIVPHTVDPKKVKEWRRLVPKIFRSTARGSADQLGGDVKDVRAVLKPEVLAAL